MTTTGMPPFGGPGRPAIQRDAAKLQQLANQARQSSTAIDEIVSRLDRAVSPALRGDVPELGAINGYYSSARTGLSRQARDLDRVVRQTTNYTVRTAAVELIYRAGRKALAKKLKKMAKEAAEKAAADATRAAEKAEAEKARLNQVRSKGKKGKKGKGGRAHANTKNRVNPTVQEAQHNSKRLAKEAAKKTARAKKLGRIPGPLGWAVDALVGANDQYMEDSKSHKSTKAKVARATTVGVTTATGAAAGTAAGAFLGTFIPIPVVGTVVGAAVGGWVGAKAGKAIGKLVIDPGKTLDAARRKVEAAGKAISHGAGKAVDAGKDAGKAVGGAAKDAGKAVGGAAKDAGKAVGGAAKDAGKAVGGAAKDAGGAIGDKAGDAYGATKDAAKDAKKSVTKRVDKVGSAISGAVSGRFGWG